MGEEHANPWPAEKATVTFKATIKMVLNIMAKCKLKKQIL